MYNLTKYKKHKYVIENLDLSDSTEEGLRIHGELIRLIEIIELMLVEKDNSLNKEGEVIPMIENAVRESLEEFNKYLRDGIRSVKDFHKIKRTGLALSQQTNQFDIPELDLTESNIRVLDVLTLYDVSWWELRDTFILRKEIYMTSTHKNVAGRKMTISNKKRRKKAIEDMLEKDFFYLEVEEYPKDSYKVNQDLMKRYFISKPVSEEAREIIITEAVKELQLIKEVTEKDIRKSVGVMMDKDTRKEIIEEVRKRHLMNL